MTISPINLGNTFTNSSGTTVLGGLSSGLNTQAVINSIVAAQSSQITTLQDQVTVNNSQSSTLTTLQNLLTALQSAAAPLSNPSSPDTTNNLWLVNTSTLTSNTTQAASNYVTADVASGTASGSYTISNITSLATASTQDTVAYSVANIPVVVASGATTGQFNAGTLTISGPSGISTVTLTAGQTLSQVAADFNAANGTTGLSATVSTSSAGVSTLVFTATTGGAPVSFNLSDGSENILDPSGVFSAQTSATLSASSDTSALVVASGATAGELNAGTVTIQGPSGSATVTFTAGDSLDDIANDFNAGSNTTTTGLTASVVDNSGTYTLTFTNTVGGGAATFNLNDASANILDPSSVLNEQSTPTYSLTPTDIANIPVVVTSGAAAGQYTAGTLSITGPGGSGTVTLKAGDTLADVAGDFNDASSSTGISASVVQTAAGAYTLAFASTSTGASTAFDLTSSGTVTSGESLLPSSSFFASAQTGTDAQFELNGTTIDSASNTISSAVSGISGVTFSLLQVPTESGASFNLSIAPDYGSIATGISNFATAYNNFLTFYAQQTQLNSSGTPASAAILYSDTTLRSIYDEVTGEANNIVANISGSNPNQLSDIGLSFTTQSASGTNPEVDNILSVDSATLLSTLQSNLTGVEGVLGYTLNVSPSDAPLTLYQSSSLQTVNAFTVNVDESDPSNPIATATYIDPTTNQSTTVNFSVTQLSTGGLALTGPSGSAINGLQLIYGGSGSESNISVTTSQGILDQINDIATGALTANTGLIADDLTSIQSKNTSLQTQITSVTTQVASTRQQLLQKYAALEAAITEANSSLDLLNAQQLVNSSSGG